MLFDLLNHYTRANGKRMMAIDDIAKLHNIDPHVLQAAARHHRIAVVNGEIVKPKRAAQPMSVFLRLAEQVCAPVEDVAPLHGQQ